MADRPPVRTAFVRKRGLMEVHAENRLPARILHRILPEPVDRGARYSDSGRRGFTPLDPASPYCTSEARKLWKRIFQLTVSSIKSSDYRERGRRSYETMGLEPVTVFSAIHHVQSQLGMDNKLSKR